MNKNVKIPHIKRDEWHTVTSLRIDVYYKLRLSVYSKKIFIKNCVAVYIFLCLFPNEASLFSTEENNVERQLLSMSELTEVTFAYLNWENTYN